MNQPGSVPVEDGAVVSDGDAPLTRGREDALSGVQPGRAGGFRHVVVRDPAELDA